MPCPAVHINQAKHNEQLTEYLMGTVYRDWIVVSMFYAALHYVEAYFDTKRPRVVCRTHTARDEAIRRDPATRPIFEDYRDLKDLSEDARYGGTKPDTEQIQEHGRVLQNIKKQLRPFLRTVA